MPIRPRPRPTARVSLARVAAMAAALPALAAGSASAEGETVYKCRKPGGGVLYSNTPCETQSAKSLKVLRTDPAQVTIREVDPQSVKPYPDPNRPLTAAEQAKYAVPPANEDADGIPVRPRPVRTPALDHIAKTAQDTQGWWGRLRDTVSGWFGH